MEARALAEKQAYAKDLEQIPLGYVRPVERDFDNLGGVAVHVLSSTGNKNASRPRK